MKHIFLHIVKTAGTSLRQVLRESYDEAEKYEKDQDSFNWQILSLEEQQKVKMIFGHLYFGVHNQINEKCRYITFLRDPVERLVSYYYYVLENPDNPAYERLQGKTFEEFVLTGARDIVSNQQTKIICGSPNVANFDYARHNIEHHFDFVGLTEQYELSIQTLSAKLKWKNPVAYKLNDTKTKQNISSEVRKKIEEVNQIDKELYIWARQNFVQRKRNA